MERAKSILGNKYFVVSLSIVAFLAAAFYVYFGIIQPGNIDKLASQYELKIGAVEVPKDIDIDVNERGEYDREEFEDQKKRLNVTKNELLSIIHYLGKENLEPVFGHDRKAGLIEAIDEKIADADTGLNELSSIEKEAQIASAAYKEEIKKKELEEANKEAEKARLEEERVQEERAKEATELIIKDTAAKNQGGAKDQEQKQKTQKGEVKSDSPVSDSPSPNNSGSDKNVSKNAGTKEKEVTKNKPNEPKASDPKETEVPNAPEPKFGAISRENMNGVDQWKWEHGEFYYQWSGDSWDTVWRYGSTVTDGDRWVNHLKGAFPEPDRDGTKVGEKVGEGTIWVFFGGKF